MLDEKKRTDSLAVKRPKILLIGATGKLGYSLLTELLKERQRYEIALLVRKPFFVHGCRNFIGDILNDNLLPLFEWADIVVNCSGFVSYAKKDRDLLRRVNVEGVKNIVSACEQLKIPLIHSSSAIAYGSSINPVAFKETDSLEKVYRGEYAKSKLEADEIVRASSIPYIIFRPGTLISTLAKLYKFYQKGVVAGLKGGASFTLRDEVAKAYVVGIGLLLEKQVQTIYNLGGNNLKFLEVFENFKDLDFRKTVLIKHNVLNMLSIVNDYLLNPVFKTNILTRDNFSTGSRFTFIDSTRAQKELNYKIPVFNLSLKEVFADDTNPKSNS